MTEKSSDERYGAVAIFFHWTSVALILAAILFAWGVLLTPKGTLQNNLLIVHRSFGISVLAVTTLRILWRATHPAPRPPGSLLRWQQWVAAGTHWLLYGLFFAMPIAGYVFMNAADRAVSFFYLFELPRFVAPDPALAKLAGRTHESLQWGIYLLVGLHAAAALRHHFVIKDNVLRRMLPAMRRRSRANSPR